MYEIIRNSVGYNKINMHECLNFLDKPYHHPFIGELAISSRLKDVLWEEFAFDCMCQDEIPPEFFKKYYMVHVWSSEDYGIEYRTSSQWASCVPIVTIPDVPPMDVYTEDDSIERFDSDMYMMVS